MKASPWTLVSFLPAFARVGRLLVGCVAGWSSQKFQLLLWKDFKQEAKQRGEQGVAAQGLVGSSDGGLRCRCRKVLLPSG